MIEWVYPLSDRTPWLVRLYFAKLGRDVRRDPSAMFSMVERNVGPSDKEVLASRVFREALARDMGQAFRQGGRGPAHDLTLEARPWGVPFDRHRGADRDLARRRRPCCLCRSRAASWPGVCHSSPNTTCPEKATSRCSPAMRKRSCGLSSAAGRHHEQLGSVPRLTAPLPRRSGARQVERLSGEFPRRHDLPSRHGCAPNPSGCASQGEKASLALRRAARISPAGLLRRPRPSHP